MRPGLSEGMSIAAAPASASDRPSAARITKEGSLPDFCGSTRTAAARKRSSGGVSAAEAGAPASTTVAAISPGVPGTHPYDPTWIVRSIGETIRPLAAPRVQRDSSGYSSKRAFA